MRNRAIRTGLLAIVAVVLTLAPQPVARAQSYTSLQFTNSTGNAVTAYLTLGADSAGRISDVRLMDGSNQVTIGNVTPDNLQGSFTLQPNQSVTWNSFNGGRASGSITFRAPPQSCKIDGGPCGVTKGEFGINIPGGGGEAVDISSVDGINVIMSMDLSNGGGTAWPSGPNGQVARNSGTLTGDKAAWGVFPYRCSICAGIGNAPAQCDNPLGPANQSYCKDGTESDPQPVRCQLNRTGAGGTVKFAFEGIMDPLGESAPQSAGPESTSPSTAAATPSPAVTTPSAQVTPSAANTPSAAVTPTAAATAQRPSTPAATAAVPTAQAQPTTAAAPTAQAQPTSAAPVPTAGP